jgi:hypothetical protein
MKGPGTVLWSLVCSSARCRGRWSAAWTWWHICVRQSGAATRPVRDGHDPAAGQDGRPAGSTGLKGVEQNTFLSPFPAVAFQGRSY